MADYQSLVETKLDPVGMSGQDIIYKCPLCDDHSGHLYINYGRGYWHCFKCDSGGKKLESLLKVLNINSEFDYDKLYTEQKKALDDILSITPVCKEEEVVYDYSTDLETLTQYYMGHIAPLSPRAYEYLLRRGMTPELIKKSCMAEGISRYGEVFKFKGKEYLGRDYSGRIMIPSLRRDGKISFYVARDYIGDKKSKYLNPPKELAVASEDVWNLDIVDSDSVIICEGVMTAIAASPIKMNAVATYGKSISQRSSNSEVKVSSQGEKLLSRKFKNYYVCYDADAYTSSLQACEYLYDRGANVYLVKIDPDIYGPKADVADIGYEEFKKLLASAVRYTGGLSTLI